MPWLVLVGVRAPAICAVLGLYGAFGAVLRPPGQRPRVVTPVVQPWPHHDDHLHVRLAG